EYSSSMTGRGGGADGGAIVPSYSGSRPGHNRGMSAQRLHPGTRERVIFAPKNEFLNFGGKSANRERPAPAIAGMAGRWRDMLTGSSLWLNRSSMTTRKT